MPTYQYACTACDQRLEAVQTFTDAPLVECPACSGRLRKVFSAVGVVFKGSGFYKNDSREGVKTAAKAEGGGEGKAEGGAKAEGGKADSSKADSGKADSSGGGKDGGRKGTTDGGSKAPAAASASSGGSSGKTAAPVGKTA